MDKRKALLIAVSVLGGLGIFLSAMPFLSSMMPTEQAVYTGLRNIAIDDIEPGGYVTVEWQRKPIIVFRPTEEDIRKLESLNQNVWGTPVDSADHPPVYVYIAISTYKGCGVIHTKEGEYEPSLPAGWFDPCHMGFWDYAGRAHRTIGVPEGVKLANLKIPKYRYLSDREIQLYR